MKLSAKIIDEKGEGLPLANLSVMVNGKAQKVFTSDYEGKYEINDEVIVPESELKISYVGYKPQTILAKDLDGKTITLKEDIETLDEVVIRPQGKPKPILANNETKKKFVAHMQKHKVAYASMGGLLGLALIALSIKKNNI
jgi:hypothetical protein